MKLCPICGRQSCPGSSSNPNAPVCRGVSNRVGAVEHNAQTWGAFARQKEARMGETEATGFVGGRQLTRSEYEAWIVESRKKARRERIFRRIFQGLGVAAAIATILGLMLWAQRASAAPMPDPDVKGKIEQKEPEGPQKGLTLSQLRDACEKRGGHWLESDDDPIPNMKVIGCLFAVPKSWK